MLLAILLPLALIHLRAFAVILYQSPARQFIRRLILLEKSAAPQQFTFLRHISHLSFPAAFLFHRPQNAAFHFENVPHPSTKDSRPIHGPSVKGDRLLGRVGRTGGAFRTAIPGASAPFRAIRRLFHTPRFNTGRMSTSDVTLPPSRIIVRNV